MHDPSELMKLIARISILYRANLRQVVRTHNLKAEQLQVMLYLDQANQWSDTVESSAHYLRLTKGTVSQSISTLTTRGFLVKHTDPHDNRVRHCALTPQGKALLEEVAQHDPFEGIPPHMASLLTPTLNTLLSTLLVSAPSEHTFGSCMTCAHHTTQQEGPWCAKLERPLPTESMHKLCRFWESMLRA